MNTDKPFYYPTNHPISPAGSNIFTYNMGRVVAVEVLGGIASKWENIYGPTYKVRYTGTERICLDFGQNWYLEQGDVFICHQNNIDAVIRDKILLAIS